MRRTVVVVAFVALVVFVNLAGALGEPSATINYAAESVEDAGGEVTDALRPEDHASNTRGKAPPAARTISPGNTSTHLWPYTSRTRSPDGRTLAINVVVLGDAAAVRHRLETRSAENWTPVEGDENVSVDPEPSPWDRAHGASRYTYVVPDGQSTGRWVRASYQLGTGAYLGERHHVRAYPSPSGQWTALQAHTEYWDWFRLRHTVTDVGPAAEFVANDLNSHPDALGATEEYHGLGGGGSNGSMIVVEFGALALFGIALLDETPFEPPDVLVPLLILGIVGGVRAVGIALESMAPGVSPKVLVGILYPLLVAGPPVVVAILARDRPALRIATIAAAALALGIVVDAYALGVVRLPERLVFHRMAFVGAFAVLAGGLADGDRPTIVIGGLCYAGLLAAPILGYI